MTLPTPPAGGTWYLDPNTNKVYLVFDKTPGIPAWLASANLDFVKAKAL